MWNDVQRCNVIRVQDLGTNDVTQLLCGHENIKPGAMCKGPDATFIVYDRNSKNILQLAHNYHTLYQVTDFGPLSSSPLFRPLSSSPLSICFNVYHGTLVLLTKTGIKGITLSTGQTLWENPIIDDAKHVCSGYGGFFVSGYGDSVTVLDAADGRTLKTILGDQGLGTIHQVACSEEHDKLAVLHGHGEDNLLYSRKEH